MTVKHKNFKGYIHFLEFSYCLACWHATQYWDEVLKFFDESVEDEMEDDPYMKGNDE